MEQTVGGQQFKLLTARLAATSRGHGQPRAY